MSNTNPDWKKFFSELYLEIKSTVNDYPNTDVVNILSSGLAKCGYANDSDLTDLKPNECKYLSLTLYYDFLVSADIDAKAEKWANVTAENEIIDIFNWTLTENGLEDYTSPKLTLSEYEEKLRNLVLE